LIEIGHLTPSINTMIVCAARKVYLPLSYIFVRLIARSANLAIVDGPLQLISRANRLDKNHAYEGIQTRGVVVGMGVASRSHFSHKKKRESGRERYVI